MVWYGFQIKHYHFEILRATIHGPVCFAVLLALREFWGLAISEAHGHLRTSLCRREAEKLALNRLPTSRSPSKIILQSDHLWLPLCHKFGWSYSSTSAFVSAKCGRSESPFGDGFFLCWTSLKLENDEIVWFLTKTSKKNSGWFALIWTCTLWSPIPRFSLDF